MNLSGIGYIGVQVPDLNAWNDYCASVLGLAQVTPGGGSGDASYMKMDDRVWRLAARQAAAPGLDFLGFEVRGPQEYKETLHHLEAAAVAIKPATDEELADRGVQAMSWFNDPAGNRLEVFWGPTQDGTFISPLGPAKFNTVGGMGHAVMMVDNLPVMLDFYHEVLSMRTSDFMNFGPGMAIHFLRCTPRHHTVALSAVGGHTGLHHIAFEVDDVNQVGRTLDRATAAGLAITASMGRHKNDKMLSFYMRSPAGFEVEVGTDPVVVDEDTWVANEFAGGDEWGHHGLTAESLSESLASQ